MCSDTSTPKRSLPTSLPPLNVSPPSFPLSQFTPSKSPVRPSASQVPDAHRTPSSIPLPAFRQLRPQKSTSFELSRRSNDSQKQSTSSGRPIITISPPRSVADRESIYVAPRAAPAPPSASPTRRPVALGVASSRENLESPPTVASSPASIHSTMRFPVPPVPAGESNRNQASASSRDKGLLCRDYTTPGEPASPLDSEGDSDTSALMIPDRSRRMQSVISPLSKVKPENTGPSPIRRMTLPSESASSQSGYSGSESTLSSRSRIPSSPMRKMPPPLMRTWRRPPTTGPPTEPLPSPPTAAKHPAGPPFSALPSIPSFPSSHKSLSAMQQKAFRARGSTVSSVSGSSLSDARDGGKSSTEIPPSPARSEQDSLFARASVREGSERMLADDAASAEQLRDALNAQSAKYTRLSSYLLTLTERHAVEKNELVRRIEVLEREARKREREIKGLRWIVANAGQSTAAARLSHIRRNSGCGSTSPVDQVHKNSLDSPAGSTEEGLFEMQSSVSDLIVCPVSPPTAETRQSPNTVTVPSRLRRSNTFSDGLNQLPLGAAKQKQARRTSSPVLPVLGTLLPTSTSRVAQAGLGLDIDMPSIPSLPGSDGRMTPASPASSLPSLTTVNTTSSGLSSIPETPRADGIPQPITPEREGQRREKEERRASWVLRRISTSSSSSAGSSPVSPTYSSNLKLGASPSIGQVLDRTSGEPDMDAILRKLRAFGHGSP
ncbi:hypothetical protein A0H81_03246 [Grifola frondosa]|uniref:Uncharacterized protein n=1 Tax=Grifola frondosa TaxID=5627 RepID=A0A1C7MIK0_GRIFR|nr:hypothetical protein A0H81_03246 [Grifola frondosa]